MKRMTCLLLSSALLLALLSACQGQVTPSETPGHQPAALEVVSAMLPVSGFAGRSESLEYLTEEAGNAELLAVYLENAYGLSDGVWEDAAVIRAAGASAF